MTIVLLLGMAWLAANATLVLMLRRSARVRERELGRAPRAGRSAPAPSRIGGTSDTASFGAADRGRLGKAFGRP